MHIYDAVDWAHGDINELRDILSATLYVKVGNDEPCGNTHGTTYHSRLSQHSGDDNGK